MITFFKTLSNKNKARKNSIKKILILSTITYLFLSLFFDITCDHNSLEKQRNKYQHIIYLSQVDTSIIAPNKKIGITYYDFRSTQKNAPIILLLNDNLLIQKQALDTFALKLTTDYRVIVPDYPGYDNSMGSISSYSMQTLAKYILQLTDSLQIGKIHLVTDGFGGGVGLRISELAPSKVSSITFASASVIQEFVLLGDYRLNRMIYGAEVSAAYFVQKIVPHTGILDTFLLNMSFSRSLYESDIRSLRTTLEDIKFPMLILQNKCDNPFFQEAAKELYRIVPHSELKTYESVNNFINNREIVTYIRSFILNIEKGLAKSRGKASIERINASQRPFNRQKTQHTKKVFFFIILLLILATFISEDLACIGAGVVVSSGVIGFGWAVIACFIGIVISNILLYFLGKWVGRPAIKYPPLKWLIKENDLDRISHFFIEKAPPIIFLSRFLPGMRLPIYFMSGISEIKLSMFLVYLLLSCIIWIPCLIGLSMFVDQELFSFFVTFQNYAIWVVFSVIAFFWLIQKLFNRVFIGNRLS